MTTPNNMPSQTDALKLARMNLRSRFQKLGGSTASMDVETIETFHRLLDRARTEIRAIEKQRRTQQADVDTSREW